MKRPAFQFYPADWRKDIELRSCSLAARGLWIDLMCVMHDCEPYGHLALNGKPMTAANISGQTGVPAAQVKRLLDELLQNGVARQADEGLIYSKRMVDDEALREYRAGIGRQNGAKGAEFGAMGAEHGKKGGRPKKQNGGDEPGEEPGKKPPQNPHPSSSSSSSSSILNTTQLSLGPALPPEDRPALTLVGAPEPPQGPPDCPHLAVLALWAEVLPQLPQHIASQWRGSRADHLRARWRETAAEKGWTTQQQGLDYLRKFFAYVGQSDFLAGRSRPSPGKRPFVIELEWLVNPSNWAKVHEGKYHGEAA
jgi:hypothetical protein